MSADAVETIMIDNTAVPLHLASPMLNRAATIPMDTRVISADADTALKAADAGNFGASKGTLQVAGMIVSRSQHRRTQYMENTVPLEIFPKGATRTRRSHQLGDFARRYAEVLRSGQTPLVILPEVGRADNGPEHNPHIQAFITGMVASAMMPNGVLLCASKNENPQGYGQNFVESDALAMAASQGRVAFTNRRILNGEPEWRHITPQLERHKRQFAGFHEKRRGLGCLAKHYLWVERDPRSIHGDPAFRPYHTVLLMNYPMAGSPPALDWAEGLTNMMRPGSNYNEDPARRMDAFRRWLVVNGRALATGSDVETPLVLDRPEKTPTAAVAADAAPAPGVQRRA